MRFREFIYLSLFHNASVEDHQHDANSALPCDKNRCHLPNCWCSSDGTEIPGNLTSPTIPQMIVITFEDAVNSEHFDFVNSEL